MRGVRASAWKAEAFHGIGNGVGNGSGIDAGGIARKTAKALLGRQDRPDEGRGIATVDLERIESVEPEMISEPIGAPLLRNLRPLLDASAVKDHDRHDETAILSSPPARRPVRAALLLEGAIAHESDQALSG